MICSGNQCCPDGSTCPSADADYSACASGKTQDCSPTVGLALQGGGWRAQVTYSGVVAGLLAYMNEQQGESTTFASSGLLDRFDTVSSVSGGSWFFTSFAFSESYASLLESIAASTGRAAKLFNNGWTTPVLKAMGVIPSVFNVKAKLAKQLADEYLGVADADTLFMIAFFLSTNATWNAFTSIQLEAGASIGPDVLMGSDGNSFVKNKLWLASHSVLLPSGDSEAFLNGNFNESRHVSYVAQSPDGVAIPPNLPAAFSIKLGAGTDSLPPHRYIAKTALPSRLELKFTGVESNNTFTSVTPLGSEDFSRGVGGRIPVADVTSASSACIGILSVEGKLWDPAIAVLGNPTPWFTNTANGGSLYDGSHLVIDLESSNGITQQSIDNLAAQQLHGLVDGGQTDQLGVANAVAAGSNEVLALTNHDGTLRTDIWEYLFQGGPLCTDPACFTSPIFADSHELVQTSFQGFHNLTISSTATILTQLAVGTITTTTVDNPYYGITAGRPITIHVVEPVGDITIGFFEDVTRYNTFLQDIVQTLILDENAEFVQATLLPMFMGSVPNGVQVV